MTDFIRNKFISFDIDEHLLIKYIRNIYSIERQDAVDAYLSLCEFLFLSGQTLSDALHDMLVYSDHELVEKYINTNDPLILKAIEFDISRIKEISKLSSCEIKKYLSDNFNCDTSLLPDFLNGDFPFNAEYFINFCKENGSGLFAKYRAFTYSNNELKPVLSPDPIRLSDLKLYEVQRNQIIENTLCFINNQAAVNVLLYGDRGTGKSSTIKALLNEYPSLRMIQLDKSNISAITELYDRLRNISLHFIIFIDDLSFSEDDEGFFILKQALDGSLSVKPNNVLIYATTNRRHIIKETSLNRSENDVHKSDAVDDNMSLSERFGLFVTFSSPNKDQLLEIALKIAESRKINIDKEAFASGLERFTIRRGGRSPRIAKQYVDMVEARLSLGLELK